MIRQELQGRFSNNEVVPRVKLIDFDRLAGDTKEIVCSFGSFALEHANLGEAEFDKIKEAQEKAESTGHTFDMYKDLDKRLGHEATIRLLEEFETADHNDFLMPGARELLELYESQDDPFCLFTFPTGDVRWQTAKIRAAGLDEIPCWMTDTADKGELLAKLYDPEGKYFVLPYSMGGLKTRSFVLIDDKASSFKDYPLLPSRGYHVVDPERAVPIQLGAVQGNVTPMNDLYEVIREESEQIAA